MRQSQPALRTCAVHEKLVCSNALWKMQLETYEDPGLDPDIDAALQDYIAARKAEKPDQDYF